MTLKDWKECGFIWIWKFLVSKDEREIFIGFYHDYEHCKWHITVKR